MNTKNPFEILRVGPDANNEEIMEQARDLIEEVDDDNERARIRKAASDIVSSPLKRLEYEILTHHGANYDHRNYNQNDIHYLHNLIFFLSSKRYNYEFGLLRDFYKTIRQQPSSDSLFNAINNGDRNRALHIWEGIIQNISAHEEPLFFHSLALLHQGWAEDFEKERNIEGAYYHWEESRKHWFVLCCFDRFWECFMGNIECLTSSELNSFKNQFTENLLKFHWNTLQTHMTQGNNELAEIHFNCITKAKELSHDNTIGITIRKSAESYLEKLTSKYLEEARRKLGEGQLSNGIRKNYSEAISHVEKFLDLHPDNKRALRFVLEQSNDWGYDLYNLDDKTAMVSMTKRIRPFLDKLASQISKGQGHILENQVVSICFIDQGMALDFLGNIIEAIKCFNLAIEYNPDNVDAKKWLKGETLTQYGELLDNAIKAVKEGNIVQVMRNLKEIPVSFKFPVSNPVSNKKEDKTAKEIIATWFNNEGVQLYKKEQLDKAREYYKKALELDPNFLVARRNLTDLENVKRELPYYQALKNGSEAYNNKQYDVAIRYLEKIPSNYIYYDQVERLLATSLNQKGIQLCEQYKFEEAVKYFEDAARLAPSDQIIQKNVTFARENQKIQKAISLNQEGVELCNQYRFDEAVVYFERAVRLDPGNQTIQKNLVDAKKASQGSFTGSYYNSSPQYTRSYSSGGFWGWLRRNWWGIVLLVVLGVGALVLL